MLPSMQLQLAVLLSFQILLATLAKDENICGSFGTVATIEEKNRICAGTISNGAHVHDICPTFCSEARSLLQQNEDDDLEEDDYDDDDDDYEEVDPRSFLRSRVARIGNIFSHSVYEADAVGASSLTTKVSPVKANTDSICLDDVDFRFTHPKSGKQRGCAWLHKKRSAQRQRKFCTKPHIKGACMETCNNCVCEDEVNYLFQLKRADKKVPCSYLLKNKKESAIRKRRRNYCLKSDGETGTKVVGNGCIRSCGFCSEILRTSNPTVSAVPTPEPSSKPSRTASERPTGTSEAPSLNPSVSVSPSSSSVAPSISSQPSAMPSICVDSAWSIQKSTGQGDETEEINCSNIGNYGEVCTSPEWGGQLSNDKTASEACCSCGGSQMKSVSPSSIPSSEPSFQPSECDDYQSNNGNAPAAQWSVQQNEINFTCDSFKEGFPCALVTVEDDGISASEACCACGGGQAYVDNMEE